MSTHMHNTYTHNDLHTHNTYTHMMSTQRLKLPSALRRNPPPTWILKTGSRLWAPYLGAGIRIKSVTEDYRELTTSLKLRWYNKNYVGTHFGGSLFAMTDPFYMLMLLFNLGKDYVVWDKRSTIEFIKPGKTEVTATFQLTEECIREIVEKTSGGKPHHAHFSVDVVDVDGDVVAKVDKSVYIRRKKGR